MDFSKINEDLPEMKHIHSLDFGEYIISYYSQKPMEISYVGIQNLLEIWKEKTILEKGNVLYAKKGEYRFQEVFFNGHPANKQNPNPPPPPKPKKTDPPEKPPENQPE